MLNAISNRTDYSSCPGKLVPHPNKNKLCISESRSDLHLPWVSRREDPSLTMICSMDKAFVKSCWPQKICFNHSFFMGLDQKLFEVCQRTHCMYECNERELYFTEHNIIWANKLASLTGTTCCICPQMSNKSINALFFDT